MTAPAPDGVTAPLVVAVCTYKRPDQIIELVPLLVEQARGLDAAGLRARVQVVDNDASGSGREALERAGLLASAGGSSPAVSCVVESTPGISAARQRCLDEAADDDWLVFIDDDERPGEGWLGQLVETARQHNAVGVAGPVRSVLAPGTDPWIVDGGFFDRRHRWGLETGVAIPEAATNNLLVDMRHVRRHHIGFAQHLGLTGGEDSLFTRALVNRGGRLVWCAEAEVSEPVPADRATRRWVLQRALSYGNAAALVELSEGGTVTRRPRLAAAALARVAGGLARSALGTVRRDTHQQAQGLRTAMRGAGMALGAAGLAWSEYARDGRHVVRAQMPVAGQQPRA